MAVWTTLGESERSRLLNAAAGLGIAISPRGLERFAEFSRLLEQWAERTNLISCRTPADFVTRHLLDALTLTPHLATARRIVDLGSGAGLPGVPLAIVDPERDVILVESRRRRTSFLRDLRGRLELSRLMVIEGRAERGPPDGVALADAVVTRAVWTDATVLEAAHPWLSVGGELHWIRAADAAPVFSPKYEALGQTAYCIDGGRTGVIETHRLIG